jgi:hypothetical protein
MPVHMYEYKQVPEALILGDLLIYSVRLSRLNAVIISITRYNRPLAGHVAGIDIV